MIQVARPRFFWFLDVELLWELSGGALVVASWSWAYRPLAPFLTAPLNLRTSLAEVTNTMRLTMMSPA